MKNSPAKACGRGDDPTGAALTGTALRELDVICLASLVLLEYDGCIGEVEQGSSLLRGDEGGVVTR